jgi:hypothetical protein
MVKMVTKTKINKQWNLEKSSFYFRLFHLIGFNPLFGGFRKKLRSKNQSPINYIPKLIIVNHACHYCFIRFPMY